MGNSKSSAHENQEIDIKNSLQSKKKRGNNSTGNSKDSSKNNKENKSNEIKYKQNKKDSKDAKKKVVKNEEALTNSQKNEPNDLNVLQPTHASFSSVNNLAKNSENDINNQNSTSLVTTKSDLIQNSTTNDSDYTNMNEYTSIPNDSQLQVVHTPASNSNTQSQTPQRADEQEPVYESTLDMDFLDSNEKQPITKNNEQNTENDLEFVPGSNVDIYSQVNLSNKSVNKNNETKKNLGLAGIFNKLRENAESKSNKSTNAKLNSSSSLNNNQSIELPSKSFDPDKEYLEQKKNYQEINDNENSNVNVNTKKNEINNDINDLNKKLPRPKPSNLVETPEFTSLEDNLESSGLLNTNFLGSVKRHPPFLPPPPSQPPPALLSNPLLKALNETNKTARENEYQHVDYEYIPVPVASIQVPTPSSNGINKSSLEQLDIKHSNETNNGIHSGKKSDIYNSISGNNNNSNQNVLATSTHYRSLSGTSTTSVTSLDNRFVNKINIVDPIEANNYIPPVIKRYEPRLEEVKSNESSEPNEAKKMTLFIKNNNQNLKINSNYEL